jgi:hypothetical protein
MGAWRCPGRLEIRASKHQSQRRPCPGRWPSRSIAPPSPFSSEWVPRRGRTLGMKRGLLQPLRTAVPVAAMVARADLGERP